uniref:Uncharacterized protein n=1 Tax=Euplotes harpa TaxID=151035 RepID=A0A7S3JKH5_9SPIT|mmetsp:Transcript_6340/g.7272  ORF Transcript_6340/g.7272 Transcript_6340/m.7272 type:complete len:156 (+) Transcript_6340:429-896(+)
MNEQAKKMKTMQMHDFFADPDPYDDSYQYPEMLGNHPHFRQRNSHVERVNLSKASSETTPNSKVVREDPSRAFEEAELKSTAISCHEKLQMRDLRVKSPPVIQYDDYQIDISNHEVQRPVYKENKEIKTNNRSLLDELFEKSNQEIGMIYPMMSD